VKGAPRFVPGPDKPPPDHRAYAADHCAQLVDLCLLTIRFCHAPRLHLCNAHPQLSGALLSTGQRPESIPVLRNNLMQPIFQTISSLGSSRGMIEEC
jgi:hypothetical protein